MSLHQMGAAFAKIPELEITKEEAQRMAEATARLNDLYGGFVIPEKIAAWINFGMAGSAVYGPRFIAYNIRKRNEAEEKTIDATSPRIM